MTAELILIIEDNERNLKLVRDLLEHAGYRTLQARSAEDGLLLAASGRPDLILMDIQLPGIDGLAALQRFRGDAATAGIPAIALTAFAMTDDRARFLNAGFDGYLQKPINVREFVPYVRGVLESGHG